MGKNKTANQVPEEHIQAIGSSLGYFFYALCKEFALLNTRWKQYQQLFTTFSYRVQLLKKTSRFSFRLVQDLLCHDNLLYSCHIVDLPETIRNKNKRNLTLHHLFEAIVNNNAHVFSGEVHNELVETRYRLDQDVIRIPGYAKEPDHIYRLKHTDAAVQQIHCSTSFLA
jgi:hypothetical protein